MAGNDAKTLDQRRAAFAWERVAEAKEALGSKFSDYTNLAKSAPALVMGNGLMQTLAFFQQKSDEARRLNRDVCGWLRGPLSVDIGDENDDGRRLYEAVMKALHGASSTEYLHATEEALEILRWIRQFAPTLGG